MSKNHFVSHFLPFQINTTIFIFCGIFVQSGCRQPFWMSENHFRSHFWPFQIDKQLKFFEIFDKMADVGHFGCPKCIFDRISDQYKTLKKIVFTIWPPAPILDVRNFWQNGWHWPFCMSEIDFRSHFRPFQIDTQLNFFLKFLTKWLSLAILFVQNLLWITYLYRSIRKLTFDRISGHFRSIHSFIFLGNFWQNGCRWPFWLSEIYFG